MEENIVKFGEKLKDLLKMGKNKKSILEIQEINDFFSDMELNPDQMEKVFEYLESNGIDVLRINADVDVDDDLEVVLTDEDEVDMEKIDLSVPDGISIEDPVRMYLKEIGMYRCFRRRKKWILPEEWLTGMKMQRSVLPKQI